MPPTIQIPLPEELPPHEAAQELLAKRVSANITQGFVTHENKTHQLPFSFYAEINIDSSSLWPLFLRLANDMPFEICCIYGLYQKDSAITGYFDKADVL